MEKTPEKLVWERKITNSLNILKIQNWKTFIFPHLQRKVNRTSKCSHFIPLKINVYLLHSIWCRLIKKWKFFKPSVFTLSWFSFMHTPAWCRCVFCPHHYLSFVLFLRNFHSSSEVKKNLSIPVTITWAMHWNLQTQTKTLKSDKTTLPTLWRARNREINIPFRLPLGFCTFKYNEGNCKIHTLQTWFTN